MDTDPGMPPRPGDPRGGPEPRAVPAPARQGAPTDHVPGTIDGPGVPPAQSPVPPGYPGGAEFTGGQPVVGGAEFTGGQPVVGGVGHPGTPGAAAGAAQPSMQDVLGGVNRTGGQQMVGDTEFAGDRHGISGAEFTGGQQVVGGAEFTGGRPVVGGAGHPGALDAGYTGGQRAVGGAERSDGADPLAGTGGAQGLGGAGRTGRRDTSGVQVRLGSRSARNRERRQARSGRRLGIIAGSFVGGLAVVSAAALLLMPGSEGGETTVSPEPQTAQGTAPTTAAKARLPRGGPPVDISTADGSRYRVQAVTGGTVNGVTTLQSSPPSGTAFPYVEYILTNPSKEKVLLDFPGDVFVRRDQVAAKARGRCMYQAGAPETMCTPPATSTVVRRLAGGALTAGDGGDKYLAPGGSYLVRATVEVPVDKRIRRGDLRLYIWKKLYVADQYAREAQFPR
ncbi:hypothetical protein ACFVH6_21465 [Spirillospora sp. NPDC127200]